LAVDLVQRGVAAIFVSLNVGFARIANNATATIPIVFAAGGDPVASGLDMLIALAARYTLPTIYIGPRWVRGGGLVSYSGNVDGEAARLAGIYVGCILKGAKPSDLPVQQTTRLELAINLKTAKALGLTIPLPLLARADEVIE
jgi:putative tryptophan/tyrosine transport system substrate-binding protein